MGWRFECPCAAEFDEFGEFGEWADGSVSEWWRLVVAAYLDSAPVGVVSCLESFVVLVVRREVPQHRGPCVMLH